MAVVLLAAIAPSCVLCQGVIVAELESGLCSRHAVMTKQLTDDAKLTKAAAESIVTEGANSDW